MKKRCAKRADSKREKKGGKVRVARCADKLPRVGDVAVKKRQSLGIEREGIGTRELEKNEKIAERDAHARGIEKAARGF